MNEDILNILSRLVGLLDQLTEEKGVPKNRSLVDKNIIKSENSTLDANVSKKGSLTSLEKKKLTETFNLFNKLFFDYQKKVSGDKKEKTLVSKIAKEHKKSQQPPPLPEKKGGFGLMSMIVAGLALLATSIGGIVAALSGMFGNLGGVVKVISKLGFMGALKIMSKTFLKKFSLKLLKRLPIIGGIIGLTFAVNAFRKGDIFLGIAELISGLLNFIPGVGPLLSLGADVLIAWAQSKGVFDKGGMLSPEKGWNTIKGWGKSIGDVISKNALYLPIIGTFKRFGMAFDAFKQGNIGEGLKQIGLGLFTTMGGGVVIKGIEVLAGWLNSPDEKEGEFKPDNSWMSRLKKWIKEKLKNLPGFLAEPLKWFGILDDDGKESKGLKGVTDSVKDASKGVVSYVKDAWNKMKGPLGDTVDKVSEFTKNAWNQTSDFAKKAWDKTLEEAPKIWATVKEYSSVAWDKAKEAGSWFADSVSSMAEKTKNMINEWIPKIVDTISGIADGAMKVLKGLADKIGGWIANLFTPEDEKKFKETVYKSEPSKEPKHDDLSLMLVKGSNIQHTWSRMLYKASTEQVKLLGNLVNIGASSLQELKRMTGNTSGGGNVTIVQPTQQASSSMINIPNNRDGYLSSPYAIG